MICLNLFKSSFTYSTNRLLFVIQKLLRTGSVLSPSKIVYKVSQLFSLNSLKMDLPLKHREWFPEKDQSMFYSDVFNQFTFFGFHKLCIESYFIWSYIMIFYSHPWCLSILNESVKDAFAYQVPLKPIFFFLFFFFFHSDSTCHRIAEMTLTPFSFSTASKG